jgi:hypothetical protein
MQPDSSAGQPLEAVRDSFASSDDSSGPRPAYHPLVLERRIDGKLWLVQGEQSVAVELVRCFPWTEPRRYLSLRDKEGRERGFITSVEELDAASRRAAEATLARSSFVLEITAIYSVEEDFELRSWRVETAHGPRAFQTPLDGWPRELDAGGLVIEDVYGDLFRIPDPDRLDPKSKRLLWAFVD